jgi:hypothetical protein
MEEDTRAGRQSGCVRRGPTSCVADGGAQLMASRDPAPHGLKP